VTLDQTANGTHTKRHRMRAQQCVLPEGVAFTVVRTSAWQEGQQMRVGPLPMGTRLEVVVVWMITVEPGGGPGIGGYSGGWVGPPG